MERVFITGARGFVGQRLAAYLADKGIVVKAMHRPGSNLPEKLAGHKNIEPVAADITDENSLKGAMEGCDTVFHLAAFAKPWARDMQVFYRINVLGTENVMNAALESGVKRVVNTSSAGTFGPQVDQRPVTEDIEQVLPPFTEYERTKKIATEKAFAFNDKGMEVVAVSPTRVFGPGELSVSNSVTRIVWKYITGGFRFLPGNGKSIGNYVFVEDVVEGHYLAALNGRPGENYILGGDNLSYVEMFDRIARASGIRRKMIPVPLGLMMAAAGTMEFLANNFGIEPAITPPFIRKYMHNWGTDVSKAKNELNYSYKTFDESLRITIDWLKTLSVS